MDSDHPFALLAVHLKPDWIDSLALIVELLYQQPKAYWVDNADTKIFLMSKMVPTLMGFIGQNDQILIKKILQNL